MKKVLVIHLGDAGYALMATGLLRELRHNMPEAEIGIVVRRGVTNIVETCPYVDEIVTYECETPESGWEMFRLRRRALRLAFKHLWKRRYDLVVTPRWDSDASQEKYVAYFCGAKYRVGYSENVSSRKQASDRGFDRFLTHPIGGNPPGHRVAHLYALISTLGGTVSEDKLELWLTDRDTKVATDTLKSCGFSPTDKLIAFAIDQKNKHDLWPIERFSELGKWLTAERGYKILILGSQTDKENGFLLQERLGKNAVDLTGQIAWRQAGALLKGCALVVGCGATLTHVASVCGVPLLFISCHPKTGAIDTLEAPEYTGPWKCGATVIQPAVARPPCIEECTGNDTHCVLNISVEEVKKAVASILGDGKRRDPVAPGSEKEIML